MTTSESTYEGPSIQSDQPCTLALVRRGSSAGAIAAVGTTAVAAIARAAGVSLEVDATPIPIPAFALWTVVGAALGALTARLLRARRRFLVVALVATGLSLVPPMALPDDAATKAVLVAAHLVAASIIIPILSQRLTTVAANDVGGRAVHLMLGPDYHTPRLTNAAIQKHLGVGTRDR